MAFFANGELARLSGTIDQTQEDRSRSFKRWTLFLEKIDITDDPYLNFFEEIWCRTLLLSAFAQTMNEASYSVESSTSLTKGTVHIAVNPVVQTFWACNRPDPHNDDGGRLSYILQQ